MSYEVKSIDLSVAQNEQKLIVPQGKRIVEVILLYVSAGATVQLAFGNGPLFMVQAPFTMEPTGEDMQNNGLYYRNQFAQPATSVELIIVYAGGELNTVMP